MSALVYYTIQPKEIDADGNELDLTAYSIQSNGDTKNSYQASIQTADKYISLPYTNNHTSIELISDQEIYFSIYNNGVLVIEIPVTNILIKGTLDYTYKVRNISGYTALVQWRLYL